MQLLFLIDIIVKDLEKCHERTRKNGDLRRKENNLRNQQLKYICTSKSTCVQFLIIEDRYEIRIAGRIQNVNLQSIPVAILHFNTLFIGGVKILVAVSARLICNIK